MQDKQKFSMYLTQAQTNVSFTSFMTAVVVFFTGLLIASFNQFDITIKIPIAFLIISTFGFLYSTLIFANAGGKAVGEDEKEFQRHMFMGDVISEYLGVYLLIFSIPLVIGVITNDIFLGIVAIVSALLGLAIYQFSGFAIIERHFKKHNMVSTVILCFGILLLLSQFFKYHFELVSVLFLVLLLGVTYFSTKKHIF